jgi:hypothetical protein
MSRFTTPLRLEDTGKTVDGRAIFTVLESYNYELGAEGSGLVIHVPTGFQTDFASVPRHLWRLFPPWGEYRTAAVLHDYLYRKASGFSKTLGDAIFLEAMEDLKVPWLTRTLVYLAVSYFGHSSYNWETPAPEHTEVEMLDRNDNVKPEFQKDTTQQRSS